MAVDDRYHGLDETHNSSDSFLVACEDAGIPIHLERQEKGRSVSRDYFLGHAGSPKILRLIYIYHMKYLSHFGVMRAREQD